MENSKVKAQSLFRAQYLYQHVLASEKSPNIHDVLPYDCKPNPTDGYLLLRTVDQLTDEEIKNLLRILENYSTAKFNKSVVTNEQGKSWLRVWIDYPETATAPAKKDILLNLSSDRDMISNCRGNDYYRTLSVAKDYLTRIGVLTSFTYLDENSKPQTLQPDEIIANGWAKTQQP